MRNAIETIVSVLSSAGFSNKKLAEYRVPKDFLPQWHEAKLVPYCDKSGQKGVLLFEANNHLFAANYTLKALKPSLDGTSRPIMCDFCYILQPRRQIALITFVLDRDKTHTVTYYCCADLRCSLHVRGYTDALVRSKTQVREDITPKARIDRMYNKLSRIFTSNNSLQVL